MSKGCKSVIKNPKRNPKINVQQIMQAATIERPVKRAIEPKPNSATVNKEELKALSGNENAVLDFVEGMLSGSPNNEQFIPESRDITTTNYDGCQKKGEKSRSLLCEA